MRNKEVELELIFILGKLLKIRKQPITIGDYNEMFRLILEYLKEIPIINREVNEDWKDIINESNKRFNKTIF